jgi:hypothetical protein
VQAERPLRCVCCLTSKWSRRAYRFAHLQPVDFMTYELILELYGALIDSIEAIVAHPVVAMPAVMPDRFA